MARVVLLQSPVSSLRPVFLLQGAVFLPLLPREEGAAFRGVRARRGGRGGGAPPLGLLGADEQAGGRRPEAGGVNLELW